MHKHKVNKQPQQTNPTQTKRNPTNKVKLHKHTVQQIHCNEINANASSTACSGGDMAISRIRRVAVACHANSHNKCIQELVLNLDGLLLVAIAITKWFEVGG